MKRFILVGLFFLSFFTSSQAQQGLGVGLPPAGKFDIIVIFPSTISETELTTIRSNYGIEQLAITPITNARLWRMNNRYSVIRAGVSYSYSDPTAGVERVRGSTSGVGGNILIQFNTKTEIPERTYSSIGTQKKIPTAPFIVAPNCDFKQALDYHIPESYIGAGRVKVAILDTGLECDIQSTTITYTHRRLKVFTRINTGKNFSTEYGNPNDKNGHGTAVASLIVRSFLNQPTKCQILPVKVLDNRATGTLFDLIQGIDYAIQEKADIINMSIVSYDRTTYKTKTPIEVAIEIARKQDIFVVTAAGNDRKDIDLIENFVYPASLKIENLLTVGAAKCSDDVASFSNYGKENVDIFSPGVDIWVYATDASGRGDLLDTSSGTSFATPIVAGMAAVLKTRLISPNFKRLKCAIMDGTVRLPVFDGKCVSGGIISAEKTQARFNLGVCR